MKRKLFICYSHKDEKVKDAITDHLQIYDQELDIWSDRKIAVGDEWKQKIFNSIETCNGAVLIVSVDFLNSKFIKEVEIPRLLKRAEKDGTGIYLFIAKKCDWQSREFLSALQARPLDGRAFHSFKGHGRDDVLYNFAKEVKERVLSDVKLSSHEDRTSSDKNSKKGNFLNQLTDFFNLNYAEFNFLPLYYLTNIFPFKGDKVKYISYEQFTLSNDNVDLYNLISNVTVEESKNDLEIKGNYSNSDKEEIKKFIHILNNNLIFNLRKISTNDYVSILYKSKSSKIDSLHANYNFFEILSILQIKPISLEEKIKLAYTHYELRNYFESAQMFLEVATIAYEKSFYALYFIAQFNLKKLTIFVRNHLYDVEGQKDLIEKLEKIDIDAVFEDVRHKTNNNFEVIKYIYSTSFHTDKKENIARELREIRNIIRDQNYGGWSSKNYYTALLNEYLEALSFLSKNYIIYDQFNEFQELTHDYVEGYFSCFKLNKNQPGKIEYLTNYNIRIISTYCRPEFLRKLLNRLNLFEITLENGSDLIALAISLIDNAEKIQENNDNFDFVKFQFWPQFNVLFSNLISLISVSNLRSDEIDQIGERVLTYISSEKNLFSSSFYSLNYFFSKKGHLISPAILLKFLFKLNENEVKLNYRTLQVISFKLYDKYSDYKLPSEQLTKLKLTFKNALEKNSDNLYCTYLAKIIERQDEEVKNTVIKRLHSNFNNDLYYFSSLFDLIDFDQSLYDQFFKSITPGSGMPEFPFGPKDRIHVRNLNEVFNLTFKYNLPIDCKFDQFRSIDPYYEWLIDLDSFDYSKFEVEWINKYDTKHYYAHYKKSSVLRKYLKSYLKNNVDDIIQRTYFSIYEN